MEKNKANGRVINPKGNTKFSQYCPKNILLFPKACFGLSKSFRNPPRVRELLPFLAMYKLKNTPSSQKTTFAKIYLGDYLHYRRGIIP